MSMLALLLCATSRESEGRSAVGHTVSILAVVATLALLGLSLYLAIKDVDNLPNLSTKLWVFLLAFCLPELYVILHGISTASMDIGFFESASLEGTLQGGAGAGAASFSGPRSGPLASAQTPTATASGLTPTLTATDSSSLW